MGRTGNEYEPSPQKIAEEAAKIRQRWSAKERRSRRVVTNNRLSIRIVDTSLYNLEEGYTPECAGWHYLTTKEMKKPKGKKPVEVPTEELVERESFQATIVNFG